VNSRHSPIWTVSLASLGAGTSLEGDRAIHLLDEEIGLHRSEVRTTQWSVSIGEIFSLYDREQLNVNPVF
jgi:hypothetical protein